MRKSSSPTVLINRLTLVDILGLCPGHDDLDAIGSQGADHVLIQARRIETLLERGQQLFDIEHSAVQIWADLVDEDRAHR